MSSSTSIDKSPPTMEVHSRHHRGVADAQFAGRLGGNQEFIADVDDQDAQSLLKKQPDAAPLTTLRESFDLRGFLEPTLWRLALMEGGGSFLLTFLLSCVGSGLTQLQGASQISIVLTAALSNFLGLGIFIFCLAPISGGHINPTITMSTFFAGLTTFPRAVLYISFQTVGAIAAGYWMRLGLGDEFYFPHDVIPGCTVDPMLVSPGQLFALEFVACLSLIFLAFGVGLDPRQGRVYGPALAPVLVGVVIGFGTLTTGLAKPGYTGQAGNPARCLGVMTAKNMLQYNYVHWLAPLAASILNGTLYFLVPPWQQEKNRFTQMIGRTRRSQRDVEKAN